MIRRPPRSTRTDTLFPTRRSSDLIDIAAIGAVKARGADRRLVRQRQIDQRLPHPGHVAAIGGFRRGAHPAFERAGIGAVGDERSEEHTSELQSLMRISYAVFCLKTTKKNDQTNNTTA